MHAQFLSSKFAIPSHDQDVLCVVIEIVVTVQHLLL